MLTPEEKRYKKDQEKEAKINDDKRKFGTKHELYVTLKVDRIDGEQDFGVEETMWKAAREAPVLLHEDS